MIFLIDKSFRMIIVQRVKEKLLIISKEIVMTDKIEIKHEISLEEIAANISFKDALKLIKLIDIHIDNEIFTERVFKYFQKEIKKWGFS